MKHSLVLPTRETALVDGVKVYIIRCRCGWSHIAPDFNECCSQLGVHKREQSL